MTCGAFAPDGRSIITASSDARCGESLIQSAGPPHSVCNDARRDSFLQAITPCSLRIWNPKSAECQFVVQVRPLQVTRHLRSAPPARGLTRCAAPRDRATRSTRRPSRACASTPRARSPSRGRRTAPRGSRTSPRGRRVAGRPWILRAAASATWFERRELGASAQVMGSLDSHTGSVECIVLAEALSLGVTAGLDGKAIIWDLQVWWRRREASGKTRSSAFDAILTLFFFSCCRLCPCGLGASTAEQ